MFCSATPNLLRQSLRHATRARPTVQQRFASTTSPPASKSRSWRSLTVRCGIAAAGVYYYNNSNVFADGPAYFQETSEASSTPLPTLDSLSPSSRLTPPHPSSAPTIPSTPSSSSPPSINPKSPSPTNTDPSSSSPQPPSAPQSSPESLESEASSQGAFNEETGEINWDCPCLGGMAHGPCGEEFRAAFSCFVFSKEEPKGMDCIEKFKGMQGCFREHPDIYGGELDEDEEGQDIGVGEEEQVGEENMNLREEENAEIVGGKGKGQSEEGAVAAAALPEDVPGIAAAAGEAARLKAGEGVGNEMGNDVRGKGKKQEVKEERKSIYDSGDERGSGKQGQLLKDSGGERSTANPDIGSDELLPKAAHDARSANQN